MALFFFHFFDGKEWSQDEQGLEIASAEQAYLEAIDTARSMWTELLTDRIDPSRCAFEITDKRALVLFHVEFSEILENCRQPKLTAKTPTVALIGSLADTHKRASAAKLHITASLLEIRTSLVEANELLARLNLFQRHPALK